MQCTILQCNSALLDGACALVVSPGSYPLETRLSDWCTQMDPASLALQMWKMSSRTKGRGKIKSIESVIMIIPCWTPPPFFLRNVIALGYFLFALFSD